MFEEAQIGGVRISAGLESLLAPALLPRGSLTHLLLLAIKEVCIMQALNPVSCRLLHACVAH